LQPAPRPSKLMPPLKEGVGTGLCGLTGVQAGLDPGPCTLALEDGGPSAGYS